MNNNMTSERLVQLIKSVEAASALNFKENSDFLENFRQILNEASPDEVGNSAGGSPMNINLDDYNDEDGMQFSPPIKSASNNSFISQIQFEKDPVEIRAQLINLVRRTPELYDKNDPRYKNNAHKGVLWSRIAREIGNGATGKKVREQWSYMRRKYEEEFQSRLNGNLPTPMDPTKRHLFTFDQLSFLEPYISANSNATRSESPSDRLPLSHKNSDDTSGRISRNDGQHNENDLNDFTNNSALSQNLNQLLLQLTQKTSTSSTDETNHNTDNNANFKVSIENGNPLNGKLSNSNVNLQSIKSALSLQDETTENAKKKRKLNNEQLIDGNQDAEIAALNASVLCLSRCLEEVLPKGGEDECTIFGRQIANDLRQLPKKRRLALRKQIADLLVQELGEDAEELEENCQKENAISNEIEK